MLFSGCRGWVSAQAPLSAWTHRAAARSARSASLAPRRLLSGGRPAGRAVRRPRAMDLSQVADPEERAYLQHQQSAAKITIAEEARTLVEGGKFGVLSTLSSKAEGFPDGSVVEYVADPHGRPIFSFSTLSPHTSDVQRDGRCSLTVLADGFNGMNSARVTLRGVVAPLSSEERDAARELYLQRHPGSFWVDFGDFSWFRMDQIAGARVVGGFGRAGKVSAEEYAAAQPDPVAKFSGPVCGHMNADHADSTVAMVKHYVGLSVQEASMQSLDRLGINLVCKKEGHDGPLKIRLPFPRPATDRKSIKELIVEMTKEAAAAASS